MPLLPRDPSQRLRRERPVVVMAAAGSGADVVSRALTQAGFVMASPASSGLRLLRRRSFSDVLDDLARTNVHLPPHVRPIPDDLARFQRGAYRYMQQASAERWGWFLPSSYLLGNFVAETFPQARLVHVVRDGRDVALSAPASLDFEPALRRRLEQHLDLQAEPAAVRAAAIWAFLVERFMRFSERWPLPALTLRYEALVSESDTEIERLANFVGAPMDAASLAPASAVEPSPAAHSDATLALIEARAGRVLRGLGYSAPERATGRTRLQILKS